MPTLTRIDIMHNTFQGSGQRLVASTIITLLSSEWWGPLSLGWPMLLKRAWLSLKRFAKRTGVGTSQPVFTRNKLGYPSGKHFPVLSGKAFNCRVCIAWLANETHKWSVTHHSTLGERALACACWSLADFCWQMDTASRVLSACEIQRLQMAGRLFLQSYSVLAQLAIAEGNTLWAVKPKMHQFDHLLFDLSTETQIRGSGGISQMRISSESSSGLQTNAAARRCLRGLLTAT